MLPHSCVMLFCMADARLFLRPQLVSHCDSGTYKAVSSASVSSSGRRWSVSISVQINAAGVWFTELLGTPDYISISRCRFWGASSPLCWFNNKEFLCITLTVEHNYISPSSTVGIQLHVSALYVGHLQVVIYLTEQIYKICGVFFYGIGWVGGTRSRCVNSGYHDLGLLWVNYVHMYINN